MSGKTKRPWQYHSTQYIKSPMLSPCCSELCGRVDEYELWWNGLCFHSTFSILHPCLLPHTCACVWTYIIYRDIDLDRYGSRSRSSRSMDCRYRYICVSFLFFSMLQLCVSYIQSDLSPCEWNPVAAPEKIYSIWKEHCQCYVYAPVAEWQRTTLNGSFKSYLNLEDFWFLKRTNL